MANTVTFQQLWDNFPGGDPYLDPKTGKPPPGYSDQCAIRMSVDLQKSGVSMTSYHDKDRVIVNGAGVARSADLWMASQPGGGGSGLTRW